MTTSSSPVGGGGSSGERSQIRPPTATPAPALAPVFGHVGLVHGDQPGRRQRDELLARRQRLRQRVRVQVDRARRRGALMHAVGEAREQPVEHVFDGVRADAQDDPPHRAVSRPAARRTAPAR
jgi:hypothetical protein